MYTKNIYRNNEKLKAINCQYLNIEGFVLQITLMYKERFYNAYGNNEKFKAINREEHGCANLP